MQTPKKRELQWKAVSALSAMVAAVGTRKALTALWQRNDADGTPTHDEPWARAVTWGAALGAGVGAMRIVARRAAAAGFERVTGDAPPVETADAS